jgi:outer membrane protein W
MRHVLIMFVGVMVLALAGSANAAVMQGDTELDLMGGWGSFNSANNGDLDLLILSASVGYFLTDNIQVSGSLLGAWLEVEDTDTSVLGVGGKAKYHFMPENQYVPYVGVQVYYSTIDEEDLGDDSGIYWGPVVGVRCELNEYNDFYAEYQYQMYEGDIGDVLDDANMILFGIIHQFK